jgi:hypothetical protein
LIDIKSWHFNGDQLSRPISVDLQIPHPRFKILRVELSSFSPSSCLETLINLIDHVFQLSVICQEAHSPQISLFAARNDIFSTTKAWYCLRWEMWENGWSPAEQDGTQVISRRPRGSQKFRRTDPPKLHFNLTDLSDSDGSLVVQGIRIDITNAQWLLQRAFLSSIAEMGIGEKPWRSLKMIKLAMTVNLCLSKSVISHFPFSIWSLASVPRPLSLPIQMFLSTGQLLTFHFMSGRKSLQHPDYSYRFCVSGPPIICRFSNLRVHNSIAKLDQLSCLELDFHFLIPRLKSFNFSSMCPI